MSDVIDIFPANNFDHVLEKARGEIESGLVIGWDKDGDLAVFGGGIVGSRQPTQADWLWIIEDFKHRLISGEYTEKGE